MKQSAFSPHRTTLEYIIFALGILACVLFFVLKDFWCTPTISPTTLRQIRQKTDSVIAVKKISRKEITVFKQVYVDKDLIDAISDSLGVYNSRLFFDTHRFMEILYQVTLTHQDRGNNVSVSINSGNTRGSRQSTLSSMPNAISTLWFDRQGNLVGKADTFRDSTAMKDSASLFTMLLNQIPSQYPRTGPWKIEQYQRENTSRYVQTLEEKPGWSRTLLMEAKKFVIDDSTRWDLHWSEQIVLKKQPAPVSSLKTSFLSALGTTYSVLVILAIIGMVGTFIARLRKKAVSVPLALAISFIICSYFLVSAVVILDSSFIILLIAGLSYLFIGFFLAGMPAAGLFSLAREIFAEKFYTLLRLLNKPWQSRYVGRSLLFGLSVAVISVTMTVLLFYITHLLGNDLLFRSTFYSNNEYFLTLQPTIAVIAAFLFIPCTLVLTMLFFPVLVYRFFPSSLRVAFSLAGMILCYTLLTISQSDSILYGLTLGILSGALTFLVLYYGDILALIVYAVASSLLSFMALFLSYPTILTCILVFLGLLLLLGVKAYLSPAESVHEEDYKPSFLYQLENERRIQQELAAAQSVQKRLLPARLPILPSVNVAAACLPALEVGGDYYDFFQLDEYRLGVLIGDVSGKGMSGAFYITLAKGVIVSQVHQYGSPSEVLKRVNALTYGVMERGKFISMIYGILDTRTNEFSFANAGHNPILVRNAQTGHVESVYTKGMAIGLDPGRIFETVIQTQTITLKPEDILLLYTDGVTEAMNQDAQEYGEERLLRTMEQTPAQADTVVSAILASVRSFIGKAKQHDDITMIVLEMRKEGRTSEALTA